ncbi:hypothetical protein EUTSA_v10025492mg [Eutrema salsugineum]|uniref:F-box/LRR-repeat protein 15/At3g58940/PEG3-like LRR domain-containing protein n=1 Tax=Eutrema salsugineum TaxID=72664 RepID=V4LZN0_EUTSA|nr:hypothetical protein EUTSA_v10025492mg [Eutrema salsugineum]
MDEAISHQSQARTHLSFRNSINRVFALQSGLPTKKLSLKYHIEEDSEIAYVCPWICYAVEQGVLELKVTIKMTHSQLSLPCELFTSKTLVKLTLGTGINLAKLPPDVSLPALKKEDLCNVLLSGCPVLEELFVRHEDYIGSPFYISNKIIKKLSVHYDYESEFDITMPCMSFDAPSLVSLDYSDLALSEYPQVNLESLVKARLDICYSNMIERPDVSSLVTGISNVETLHLSPASSDVISRCVGHGLLLPLFDNLVNLSFGSKNKRGWKLLPYLLRQSPKLETLIIQDLNAYTDDVSLPPNQMKVLHILGYRRTAQELEQLKSLLTEFECIEFVQVDVSEEDDGIILQATKDLMMLPGVSVSSKCHIKITHCAS